MKIRLMQAEDLAAVAQIDELCFSQPWPPAAFEDELVNTNARCWVAEYEGQIDEQQAQIVAALVIWRVLDEAHIATIAVHPNFQRRGIGQSLLNIGIQAAYAEGARIYYLEVRAGNLAAIQMYTDFGFIIVGNRKKYYKDNGEDALLMTLELKDAA